MAIMVYHEHTRKPNMMLLNLVEVAMSHTGVKLGTTFACVLKEFGIQSVLKSPEIVITHISDACCRFSV
jgi:hypothetical protein